MTPNQIRAKLIERDSNIPKFAAAHDHKRRTVNQIIKRYAGTKNKPRGILTVKILQELSQFIGEPIIDGIVISKDKKRGKNSHV